MADESKTYQRKAGDTSVFVNQKRTEAKHPLLWGKIVVDPKELMKHLEENPSEDGLVELRLSLWGYEGKNGQYWNGKAQIPTQQRTETTVLPPTSAPLMGGLDDAATTTVPAPPNGEEFNDLPF